MIYLASASPRRQELLRQIGVAFTVMPSNVLEVPAPGESARAYVARVARDKAHFVASQVRERELPAHPVLAADTEVVLADEVLGKPREAAQAAAMLRRLAGRTHAVLTAVTLVQADREWSALSESEVTLAELTDAEIDRYVATGEPLDKAGGYAIQGQGGAFVTRIQGSYSGIVGLPLFGVAQLLRNIA